MILIRFFCTYHHPGLRTGLRAGAVAVSGAGPAFLAGRNIIDARRNHFDAEFRSRKMAMQTHYLGGPIPFTQTELNYCIYPD